MRGANFKGDVRGKCCFYREVGTWNTLPGVVVEADRKVAFEAFGYAGRAVGCGPLQETENSLLDMLGTDILGQRAWSCAM